MTWHDCRKSLAILIVLVLLGAVGSKGEAGEERSTHWIDALLPDTAYIRKTDRTHFFVQSQLKYGVHRRDFLSRWMDRPLFIDPAMAESDSPSTIQVASFHRSGQKVQDYGLDGMAIFPQAVRRHWAYDFVAQNPLDGFLLIPKISPGFDEKQPFMEGLGQPDNLLARALEHPHSFKVDGKLVVTTYRSERWKPEEWAAWLHRAREQYDREFLVLLDLTTFDGRSIFDWRNRFAARRLTAEDIARAQAYLRSYLRVADGVALGSVSAFRDHDRLFYRDFYENFVLRLIKSVLAEEEFLQKYLGFSAAIGHFNNTRVGMTFSPEGTRSLRRSMEASLSADPDFINIPEWDEQNENTSLRPTVYTGTSSMRIIRYYTSRVKGEILRPLPQDDVSIPNLVLSYRKQLVLGEKLQFEVLHVPDGSSREPVTAHFELLDERGQVIHRSEAMQFDPQILADVFVELPSETLAEHAVVFPRLIASAGDREQVFDRGMHHVSLRPTWNYDYTWVKQPLRDLLPVRELVFALEPAEDGRQVAQVHLEAEEPLAYVEVLDEGDTIYVHALDEDSWRETQDTIVLNFEFQSMDTQPLAGSVTLQGASGRWQSRLPVRGQTLVLDRARANLWISRSLLAIPRSEAANASLYFDWPGVFEGEIPVQQILENGIHGWSGPQGLSAVLSRYQRQLVLPDHLNASSARFEARLNPDLPRSVIHVQAVAKSGRVYRSRPVMVGEDAGTQVTARVYSASEEKSVPVSVDASRLPEIRYRWEDGSGTVLRTEAGRSFWGILGGYAAQATAHGGGETGHDGTPFLRRSHYPKEAPRSAPQWVNLEAGGQALSFDGQGTFITLPQGVIPRLAAYTIQMRVRPETLEGRQMLIANRAHYGGSLMVHLENGEVRALFQPDRSESETRARSGLFLKAGVWQDLTLRYDLETLTVEIDGKSSGPLPLPGPGLYDTVSVVGGHSQAWFHGQIADLRIGHAVSD